MSSSADQSLMAMPRRRRVALAGAAASAVEWYEYYCFGIAAALVFGKEFFPSFSPVAGVLASFATFFVGFLARPLGGVIAGHWGDRYGRKPMLVGALVLMSVATTLIGVLPTFAEVGVVAPVLLVLLRGLQGLGVGAMWGGAMLLATEYAPSGKKALYGSLVTMGISIGLVTANGLFLLAAAVAPGEALFQWGWRLPFLFCVLVLALAWYIQRNVDETPEFRQAAGALEQEIRKRRSPLRQVLREHLGTVVLAAGSFLVAAAGWYITVTGVLDYATRELGLPRQAVLVLTLLVSVAGMFTLPLFAALSDRVGRLRVYLCGAVGIMVWAIPMFLLIDTGNLVAVAIAMFVTTMFITMMTGPQGALFAELFEPQVRYTGASIGYQLGTTIGGGLAPFVMVLLLETTGTSMSISIYMIALGGVAVVAIRSLRKRARAGVRTHRKAAARTAPGGQ